jgi:hypothetical protein
MIDDGAKTFNVLWKAREIDNLLMEKWILNLIDLLDTILLLVVVNLFLFEM